MLLPESHCCDGGEAPGTWACEQHLPGNQPHGPFYVTAPQGFMGGLALAEWGGGHRTPAGRAEPWPLFAAEQDLQTVQRCSQAESTIVARRAQVPHTRLTWGKALNPIQGPSRLSSGMKTEAESHPRIQY